jgi:hypothetical protein
MITLAKLKRLWQNGRHRALIRELVAGRPESRLELDVRLPGRITAAALGVIRLVETNQTRTPLFEELRQTLLWTQNRDGSFSEPADATDETLARTALVRRALLSTDPDAAGRAADHLRRTYAAGWGSLGLTTPFVLLQLGRMADEVADLSSAFSREPTNGPHEVDAIERWAWRHARLRCKPVPVGQRSTSLQSPAELF